MKLDSGRIYEVTWERIDGKIIVPTELVIDGKVYDTMNYFELPYKADLRRYVRAYIQSNILNPTRVRVAKQTQFGVIFRVYSDLYGNTPGSFFSKWFDSWFDPVASINWSVHDVTDSYQNEYILFDNNFFIKYN